MTNSRQARAVLAETKKVCRNSAGETADRPRESDRAARNTFSAKFVGNCSEAWARKCCQAERGSGGVFIVLPKLLAGAMEAGLQGDHGDPLHLCHFDLAVSLLREGEERTIFGFELGKGVAQSIELLVVHFGRSLWNLCVCLAFERREKALP